MNTLEALEAVKALIEDPARWTQKTYARRSNGEATNSTDPEAVRWCLNGACKRVTGDSRGHPWAAIEQAAIKTFHTYAVNVNDGIGHSAVMQVLDAAIEAERSKSGG